MENTFKLILNIICSKT